MNKQRGKNLPKGNALRKTALLRGLVLAAAIGVGMTTMYLATAPSALAATVVASVDGGGSWVERMHGHSHARMHAHFDQVLTDAGVGAAQKQQIHAIASEAMAAQHEDMQLYHASAMRLKDLLAASQFDDAAIESVCAEQDQLMLDTSRRLSETAIRIAKVLTPAQRQALGSRIDRIMKAGIGHHHSG